MRERIRARFSKLGEIRYISHLDLMRVFERTIRRAKLPVWMTEGFNPRPRISVPSPLGVGVEGTDEVVEFEFRRWVRPPEVQDRLNEQLPKGLEILSAIPIRPGEKGSPSEVEYELTPNADAGKPGISQCGIDHLLAREQVIVERKRKGKSQTVDIRPYIRDVVLAHGRVKLTLTVTPTGTARPDEVLSELGLDAPQKAGGGKLTRTRVCL